MTNSVRTTYLDYLRVVAMLAVIIIHVTASVWSTIPINTFAWLTLTFYDSLVRWCVPIFVMISGALFLTKESPVRLIYSKYILRLVSSFIIWAVIYALLTDGPVKSRLISCVTGHYHMWFIPMIIGLYMITPILRPIIKSERTVGYFLLLALIFAIVMPWTELLISDFGPAFLLKIVKVFKNVINDLNLNLVIGYPGYFLLGYYLYQREFTQKQRGSIYIIGVLGAVSTFVLTMIKSVSSQQPCESYFGYFNINVLVQAIAVFVFFKYCRYPSVKLNLCFAQLSKTSYGAYLVHALLITKLSDIFGLNAVSFFPPLAIIVVSLIIFVLSFAISNILNKIPVVKTYAV